MQYYLSPVRLAFGLVFLAVGAWAIWDGVGRGAWLRHRAAVWSTTTGVVEEYEAVCHAPRGLHSAPPDWCEITLAYRYTASGRPYRGSRYALSGNTVYTQRRFFERIESAHASGDTVKVYYDPADPSRAVLSRYVDQAYGLAFIGFLALLVFAILFVLPYQWMYRLAGVSPDTADQFAREDYQADRES